MFFFHTSILSFKYSISDFSCQADFTNKLEESFFGVRIKFC
jgi:hypothetical protein